MILGRLYIDIYILNKNKTKKKTSADHKDMESFCFLGPSFSKRSWKDRTVTGSWCKTRSPERWKSSSRVPLDSDLIGWEGAVGGACLRHGWWAAASSSGAGEAGTPATSVTELGGEINKMNHRRSVMEQRTWRQFRHTCLWINTDYGMVRMERFQDPKL